MKIKALIVALGILGTSSLAMARPVITYQADAELRFGTSRPVVRDHRSPTYHQGQRGRWTDRDMRFQRPTLLAEQMQFGDTEYRKDIVPGAAGRFRTLTIEADGGSTYIMKVVIEFADGGVQQINVGRTLRGYQSMTLDLDGNSRSLHRILVYRADGGEALNMNRRHYGSFNVVAQ